MIELVMTVCLLAAPEDCRKERLPFNGPLRACALAGQFEAATWEANHHGWRVKRWSCGPAEREV